MRYLLLFTVLTCVSSMLFAQSSFYTLVQGGANIGFANEGYRGNFSGYSVSFVFGKNYQDRAYLGLGVGNERLKGEYQTNNPHHDKAGQVAKYDRQLFPLFIDGRLPIGVFNTDSKIGVLVNGGYAPSIAANYDKGFLFKAGLFYVYERMSRLNWTVSAAYGYQSLAGNRIDVGHNFQHQQFNLTVGIISK